MTEGTSQTPLSELIRYGAAGTAGTVAEPYTIRQKAAAPAVQVYYASGCTLAEAYYQSVSGPYQLLIVGDPLCRPWANVPQVSSGAVRRGATLKGIVEIRPSATFATAGKKLPGGDPSNRVARYELYVDGRQTAWAAPGDALVLNTRRLADGFHELRIVAIAAGAIETQGRAILRVIVDNHGRTIDFTADATAPPAGKNAADNKAAPAKARQARSRRALGRSAAARRQSARHGRNRLCPQRTGAGAIRRRRSTPLRSTRACWGPAR